MVQQDPVALPAVVKPPDKIPEVVADDIAARLGIPSRLSGPPLKYSFVCSTSTPVRYQRIYVRKPTSLILIDHSVQSTDVSVENMYMPGQEAEDFLGSGGEGLRWAGLNMYLWAPGIWYIGFLNTSGERSLTFAGIESEDPLIHQMLRECNASLATPNSDTTLTAATVTNLLLVDQVIECQRIEVQNTGATNEMRITTGTATPSATRGIRIAPGATYIFEGRNLTTAQIRGFSTGGTTAAIVAHTLPWVI